MKQRSPALQKLLEQFGRQLPDKLAEIKQLHDSTGADDASALQDYYTAVHRIAGSSGSYGYKDVSESARILDRYLSDVLAGECRYEPDKAASLLEDIEKSLPKPD